MNEMKNLTLEMVQNFSLDLLHQKPFQKIPKPTNKLLEKAYEFVKTQQLFLKHPSDEPSDNNEKWWVAGKNTEKITKKQISSVKEMKWECFDEYKKRNFLAYELNINESLAIKVTCTCREFMKDFQCVHSVALSMNKKLIQVPQEVKQKYQEKRENNIRLPNDQGRQRGRPKKATRALIIQ